MINAENSQIDHSNPSKIPTAEESKAMLDSILTHHPEVLRNFIKETIEKMGIFQPANIIHSIQQQDKVIGDSNINRPFTKFTDLHKPSLPPINQHKIISDFKT